MCWWGALAVCVFKFVHAEELQRENKWLSLGVTRVSGTTVGRTLVAHLATEAVWFLQHACVCTSRSHYMVSKLDWSTTLRPRLLKIDRFKWFGVLSTFGTCKPLSCPQVHQILMSSFPILPWEAHLTDLVVKPSCIEPCRTQLDREVSWH